MGIVRVGGCMESVGHAVGGTEVGDRGRMELTVYWWS
jgi:hypothetical protein